MWLFKQAWFRVTIDVVHDLTAGLWPGAAVTLWVVRGGMGGSFPQELLTGPSSLGSAAVTVLAAVAATLAATGILRFLYRRVELPEDVAKARGRIAIYKHVLFVTVFVVATVVAFGTLQ